LVDGYCLGSIHADDLPRLNPPHEYKSTDSVAGSWDWVNLSVIPYIEVCSAERYSIEGLLTSYDQSMIVMIAARPHPESTPTRVTHSRVAVYKIPEFNPEAVPDPVVSLEKVGEWFLNADARSIGFVMGYSRHLISLSRVHTNAFNRWPDVHVSQ
jgi:hypothetical protein